MAYRSESNATLTGIRTDTARGDIRANFAAGSCFGPLSARALRRTASTPAHGVGPRPRSLLKLTAVDAELIGGWGMSITWSDGHSTGIFAWSILRAWQTPEPDAPATPEA